MYDSRFLIGLVAQGSQDQLGPRGRGGEGEPEIVRTNVNQVARPHLLLPLGPDRLGCPGPLGDPRQEHQQLEQRLAVSQQLQRSRQVPDKPRGPGQSRPVRPEGKGRGG